MIFSNFSAYFYFIFFILFYFFGKLNMFLTSLIHDALFLFIQHQQHHHHHHPIIHPQTKIGFHLVASGFKFR